MPPWPSDILNYLKEAFPTKRLLPEHVYQQDSPITPKEIASVIKKLKNNKAPGPDGYGAKFYKVYIDLLLKPLTDLLNDILTGEELPPSWASANIVVIPKAGRDLSDPKSYRPISLLNSDYKIFTAVLTNHLNNIIGHYVHPDQMGFIPNRYIRDNIYRTLDIINYGKRHNEVPSMILSLDIEKAFDRVEPSYIYHLLQFMGFGPKFLQAISVIYGAPKASMRINGVDSLPIYISRRMRQCCLLFPLLFALAIELLAELLRTSEKFVGVSVRSQQHKICLLADDIALYITHPSSSLPEID